MQLQRIDAPIGAARGTYRVERDEANAPGVVHVISGAGLAVLIGKAVPSRFVMGLDELHPGDRTPRWVSGHVQEWPGHEELRVLHEHLERPVAINTLWQRQRLARAGHRPRQGGRDDANPLAHLFVVSIAAEPRASQPGGLERLDRLLEQTRRLGEAQVATEHVAVVCTVGLPAHVVRPSDRLHAFISGRA